MDSKTSAGPASSLQPSPKMAPIRRRRPYTFLSIPLVLLLGVYFFYPWPTDRQPRPFRKSPEFYSCNPNDPVKRVAVIGAGSAGSSAAYYLSKYTHHCNRVNVTIYERSPYIGGRSTTVNVYDSASEPVELGASIFVEVNRNLVSAVEEFGLSTETFPSDEEEYANDLGVYNGKEWVFVSNRDDSYWWNAAKMIWRYGMDPLRTQSLMKSTTEKFFKMYDAPHFPFLDLSQVIGDVGLTEVTAVAGESFLKSNGIGEKFGQELIQASTRVNYAQNLDTIHGVETMVCMAASGAMSVRGGNWRIFANMVIASKANVKLDTSVTGLALQKDGTYQLTTYTQSSPETAVAEPDVATYDDVILAAPLQFANLTITPSPLNPPSVIPYVNLHVTLFTSPHRLNPFAFNLPINDHVPSTILTTLPGKGLPSITAFYSISTIRSLINPSTGEREYLYKIFSPAPLSGDYLHEILLGEDDRDAETETYSSPVVTWKYEKLWQSYPVELPRVTFEETIIDLEDSHLTGGDGKSSAHKGHLWYTSGIESFISTMETSSLMGNNVARLIVDKWIEQQKCGEEEEASVAPDN